MYCPHWGVDWSIILLSFLGHLGRTAAPYQQRAFAVLPSHPLLSMFVWTTEKLLGFSKPHLLTLSAPALQTWSLVKRAALVNVYWFMKVSLVKGRFQRTEERGGERERDIRVSPTSVQHTGIRAFTRSSSARSWHNLEVQVDLVSPTS